MTAEAPPTDLSRFTRSTAGLLLAGFGRYTWPIEMQTIAELNVGVDPRKLPVEALRLASTHHAIYLAERTVTGIVRRPDLFSVVHEDPVIKAETEAAFWPILDDLLAAAARAFSYGTVGVVFDVVRENIVLRVPASTTGEPRKKTLAKHTHFGAAFELHPDFTQIEVEDNGRWDALVVDGKRYDKSRSHLWSWDPEFGEVCGQAARRRAWRALCEDLILGLLEAKYLERSVDPPRVIKAPDGDVTVDGQTMTQIDHALQLAAGLRGGGVAGLPSERDENGNPFYELTPLTIPDRSQVWFRARDRRERAIMLSYLAAPGLAGLDDASAGDSKTLEGMLREYVEQLATWVAKGLTRCAEVVHAANHDPEQVPPPYFVATDVGKQAAKRALKELLGLANAQPAGEIATRMDVPATLDMLGAPIRDASAAPPPPPVAAPGATGRDPGRPLDNQSDRQDRRDRAVTPDGENDTGGTPPEDA